MLWLYMCTILYLLHAWLDFLQWVIKYKLTLKIIITYILYLIKTSSDDWFSFFVTSQQTLRIIVRLYLKWLLKYKKD